jgi:hypothetical protein
MKSTRPKLPTEDVGDLVVTTMVEALMPNYAPGQQVSRTDDHR